MMYLADALASFMLETRAADVPEEQLAAAHRACFDAVGASLAGRSSPHGQLAERYVTAQHEAGQATLLGSGTRTSAPNAALANGVFVHADDFDDSGGYGHPSCALVPALLAAAELAGPVSGSAVLAAYCLGYEVGLTMYRTGNYQQYDQCFHSTPVFGTLAAACAVSRLLGLTSRETTAAIGIAASTAGGLGRNAGTTVKPLHAGISANGAILAALLAAEGIAAADNIIEARSGFAEVFFQHRALNRDAFLGSLGNPFKLASNLSMKRYPCCAGNITALAATSAIMAEHGLSYDEVESVVVSDMPETSPVLRFNAPERGLNGKFCVRYTVASLIQRGDVRVTDFSDEAVSGAAIRAAIEKVDVGVLPRSDRAQERKGQPNPVRVRTKDGRVYDKTVHREAVTGSAARPFSWDELTGKFAANAGHGLPRPARVAAAVAAWRRLPELPDVREAIAAVSGADGKPAGGR
jgi:2-methylcitrate dehydratase PrpD